MAKKTNPQQPSIFKKEIQQMPEGYYSSGPNPNLKQFVEEHATAYDPETDDYLVPPFDKPITTTKATPIYNMHAYWSKKPHDAIQKYIKHYTQPGDLVLDPFCGSGGTALAALLEGRKAIAIDLSPAATFITKNYCTPTNPFSLLEAFENLENNIKTEIDSIYETRCDRCDGKAITNYVVYSYIFQCPRCLDKIAFFDCEEYTYMKDATTSKKIRVCPNCKSQGVIQEISTNGNRFPPIPTLVNYSCLEGCKPPRDVRSHKDANKKKRKYFFDYDIEKIFQIENLNNDYWFPENRMMNSPANVERWGMLYSTGVASYQTIPDLYTKRNLLTLSIIRENVKENAGLMFAFSGTVLNASKFYRHREGGGGGPAGNISIPQIFREMNVWNLYRNKFQDVLSGYKFIENKIHNPKIIVSTESATKIPVSNDSIDYVFTDPPYSNKFPYGELNFIWESWLGLVDVNWHELEIIVNEVQGKGEYEWEYLLTLAFSECFRVLKPGRWLSLCYHDTSEGTWQIIQDIMAKIGFIFEDVGSTLFIDAGQKSIKQILSNNVTKRDLVINFRKPLKGETNAEVFITGKEDQRNFLEKARNILLESLDNFPGCTGDKLYDQLVSRMVRKGEFERHDFITLLRSVAEEVQIPDEQGKVISRWYLLEAVDAVDEAESKKEEAAAKRLEAFMNKYIKEHPEFDGAHYSDLFEQYLPVKEKPRRLLIDWLPEYFYRTTEGTWRHPQDDEERQQKSELRSSGSLRRIRRFINAILNSAPPSEKDRPENAATLANWIYQCRRAGLFEQGKLLYEQGGLSFENLSEEAQLAVQEDYQICIRRARQAVLEKDIKNQKNKSQASLF